MKKGKIDYLIIDTYFDVLADVIIFGKNQFITNSHHLESTDFNNLVVDKPKFSLRSDYERYFELWKEACDKFFKFMEENCNNIKIILNCNRSVSKYYDGDKLVESDNLKSYLSLNKYRDILDSYILENYDVEVLEFDDNTLAFKNHIFGLGSTHYESKYYTDKTNQLNEIINRNSSEDELYNDQIKLVNRNRLIKKFRNI